MTSDPLTAQNGENATERQPTGADDAIGADGVACHGIASHPLDESREGSHTFMKCWILRMEIGLLLVRLWHKRLRIVLLNFESVRRAKNL